MKIFHANIKMTVQNTWLLLCKSLTNRDPKSSYHMDQNWHTIGS